ncbi:ankyrin repeat protein [Colletotrichum cereale]|nr:ankyrin repeat protein [Colletotrichum cereale]
MFDGLSGPSGPIEGCRTAVAELLSLLPPNQNQGKKHGKSRRRRVQVALETLAWPLKETKARKLLEDIAQHKGTISFALTTDTAHCIRNIQKLLTESQQNEVYKSLNDVDPSSIHHRACGNHEPGTCDWMSRLPEWSKFLDGNIRCLWIHGIPGAGKTVLASQLIGNIEKHCMTLGSSDVRSISIYYYCYFGNNQDETASFLKWALVCLCRQAQQVPERLWEIFQHGGQPSIESLLSALEAALEKFHYVFITIDAIDESKPRDELLKVIRDLTTDHRFAKIRLLATSREYLDIEKGMEDISTEVSMRNPYLDADIRLYTHSRLNNHDKMKNWPPELRNETLEALCGGAKGMYVLRSSLI